MSRQVNLRAVVLPLVGAALVSGVLGVQLANGGGDFAPLPPANPCTARAATSVSSGIDGLTERLVLMGVNGAACRLGVTREALTVQLAQEQDPSTRQVDALRAGLLEAVDRMKRAGTLPPVSALVDEALDRSDLNGFVKAAIRALPDSVVDRALSTDDVLRRAITNLDLRAALANLSDPDRLNQQVGGAVQQAVEQSLESRLGSRLEVGAEVGQ